MHIRTLCAVVLLTSCSADPAPCELSGAYRISAREVSGDCGPMPDQVDSTMTAELPGCSQRRAAPPPDVECGLNYTRTCVAPDGSSLLLGVSIARELDDETWSGAADATLRDAAGRVTCHSLYRLTFTRQ